MSSSDRQHRNIDKSLADIFDDVKADVSSQTNRRCSDTQASKIIAKIVRLPKKKKEFKVKLR